MHGNKAQIQCFTSLHPVNYIRNTSLDKFSWVIMDTFHFFVTYSFVHINLPLDRKVLQKYEQIFIFDKWLAFHFFIFLKTQTWSLRNLLKHNFTDLRMYVLWMSWWKPVALVKNGNSSKDRQLSEDCCRRWRSFMALIWRMFDWEDIENSTFLMELLDGFTDKFCKLWNKSIKDACVYYLNFHLLHIKSLYWTNLITHNQVCRLCVYIFLITQQFLYFSMLDSTLSSYATTLMCYTIRIILHFAFVCIYLTIYCNLELVKP